MNLNKPVAFVLIAGAGALLGAGIAIAGDMVAPSPLLPVIPADGDRPPKVLEVDEVPGDELPPGEAQDSVMVGIEGPDGTRMFEAPLSRSVEELPSGEIVETVDIMPTPEMLAAMDSE